jgi:hypothetical protein
MVKPEKEPPFTFITHETRRRRFQGLYVKKTPSAPVTTPIADPATTLVTDPSADLGFDGVDLDFGSKDNNGIDTDAPVETLTTDDAKWEGLLDKLVLTYKMSCAKS